MTGVKRAANNQIAKKAAKKSSVSAKSRNLEHVFSALRSLMKPYEDTLSLKAVKPGYCYLESRTPTYKNRPMYFAGVGLGENYVSYYLMSIYAHPDFVKNMSPELKKRMQGKARFNFTAVDGPLFHELGRLTRAGYEKFKNLKYL